MRRSRELQSKSRELWPFRSFLAAKWCCAFHQTHCSPFQWALVLSRPALEYVSMGCWRENIESPWIPSIEGRTKPTRMLEGMSRLYTWCTTYPSSKQTRLPPSSTSPFFLAGNWRPLKCSNHIKAQDQVWSQDIISIRLNQTQTTWYYLNLRHRRIFALGDQLPHWCSWESARCHYSVAWWRGMHCFVNSWGIHCLYCLSMSFFFGVRVLSSAIDIWIGL